MSRTDDFLTGLVPDEEDAYRAITDYLTSGTARWEANLEAGLAALVVHLDSVGYRPVLAAARPELAAGHSTLGAGEVLVSARVKAPDAIMAKMRRYGEPLRVMLDRWGYRIVVTDDPALTEVADHCEHLWDTPTDDELLLRNGALQFAPRRDYRRRDHAGLSAATTNDYDQAVHLNRKPSFGIVEIQVMTFDLYKRVHCDPTSADSHDAYVSRREELLRDRAE